MEEDVYNDAIHGENAKDILLRGASLVRPVLDRLLADAKTNNDKNYLIVAMQQIVFDHYISIRGMGEALNQISIMYKGHVRDNYSLQ